MPILVVTRIAYAKYAVQCIVHLGQRNSKYNVHAGLLYAVTELKLNAPSIWVYS